MSSGRRTMLSRRRRTSCTDWKWNKYESFRISGYGLPLVNKVLATNSNHLGVPPLWIRLRSPTGQESSRYQFKPSRCTATMDKGYGLPLVRKVLATDSNHLGVTPLWIRLRSPSGQESSRYQFKPSRCTATIDKVTVSHWSGKFLLPIQTFSVYRHYGYCYGFPLVTKPLTTYSNLLGVPPLWIRLRPPTRQTELCLTQ
ncbi:hypothetical protein RRG08_054031 [Elysia crispata]|uniref:Uncharacterized protein n=1 Tax=Elysia crispata TaxID=231223 RepID=A0AAE0ZAB0_9GAST|nr:hypothetical protein RRG08_054031 [Elysia crispata]